ncbi:hypothetical protein [Proteiniphilum sp.]|uniref:hypothetical protein n=1 Tax=Proteiniphilum sp. TaxID=1926877 RepID=UPI00332E89CA
MIAVIKGDIISSRKVNNSESWLLPLKNQLNEWGQSPKQWELVWGDSFQLEIDRPEEALRKSLIIKALVKRVVPEDQKRKSGLLDVRMAIGIGNKTYTGERISESNGEAFIFAGEKFEELEKGKVNLLIKSPWEAFDEEMNLYLKLASLFMDNWMVASAELIGWVLKYPDYTQKEIGDRLGIKQNSVSGRWRRAHVEELLAVDQMYRRKLKKLQS